MATEKLKSVIDEILGRVSAVRGKGEQATKQSLVLPMVSALGYDIWNPSEVCPEYDADFQTKKFGQKEKVDLAVILNDQPRIYFEVKDLSQDLQGHEGQLARYFNSTPSVSLAVLTNGIEYRFFTDSEEINILDQTPFYVARLDSFDPGLDILSKFQKSVFSHEAIREFATELNYRSKMVRFLRQELDLRDRDPGEGFVRWVLAADAMYDRRVTYGVVERMSPIVKNALTIVLRDIVRRSVAALDDEVVAKASEDDNSTSISSIVDVVDVDDPSLSDNMTSREERAGIVTTQNELECFAIVKSQFDLSSIARESIYDPSLGRDVPIEIAYKDTTGYFGIYFNKPSWWIMRLVVEAKTPWVGFNLDSIVGRALLPPGVEVMNPSPWAPFRVAIAKPDDLRALSPLVAASFRKAVEDRALKQRI